MLFRSSTVAPPKADMDSKTPSKPSSAADVSGADKMKAMSNLKPDLPTTSGSSKISAQPAPPSASSSDAVSQGNKMMDTMNKATAPTPSSPAPSMSMQDPKAKALKESVQIGDYNYRIV